jgi:translocation and assembly module TamB
MVPASRSTVQRWSRRVGRAVLGIFIGLLALLALGVVALNVPRVRNWVGREVAAIVSRQIAGTLTVTRVGRVGFISLAGVDLELKDDAGRRVLSITDLAADLDTAGALRALLDDGPLALRLERVEAATARIDLHLGAGGELALLTVLASRERGPGTSEQRASPSRPLRLEVDALRMGEVLVRGGPLGSAEVALHALEANGHFDERALSVELVQVRVDARRLSMVETLSGQLSASLWLPTSADPPQTARADARWNGSAGDIPVDAVLLFDRGQLSGYVRARASLRALAQLWPESAGAEARGASDGIDLLIAVDGSLDDLSLRAVLESGGGELQLDAHLDVLEGAGRATLFGSGLDAAYWFAAAPPSSLRFVAALALAYEDDALTGRLALRSAAGWIGARPLPELAIGAELGRSTLDARLRVELPGAAAQLELALPRETGSAPPQLGFALRVDVTDLRRALSRMGWRAALAARGTLAARGRLELGAEPILHEGRMEAKLSRVSHDSASAARAALDVSAHGPLTRPQVAFRLEAVDIALPHVPIERLHVRGEGGVRQLSIEARLEPAAAAPVRISARLSPAEAALSDLVMRAGSGADAVHASARRLRLTPGGYELMGFRLTGPGQVELDVEIHGNDVRVRARARAFSAAELARRVGLALEVPEAVADLSLWIDHRRGRLSGALVGSVERIELDALKAGTVRVDLRAEGGVLRGAALVQADPLGELWLEADAVKLPARWRRGSPESFAGRLELWAAADLAQLARLDAVAPFAASLGGSVELRLSLLGGQRKAPQAHLALVTRDLVWSPSRVPAAGAAAPAVLGSTSWRGMDVALRAELGESFRVEAALLSEESVLVSLAGNARLPLARVLREPASIDPRELHVDVQLQVPERRLGAFPAPLRFAGVDGTLRAEAAVRGTIGRPELTTRLELSGLRLENSRRALPLAIVAAASLTDDRVRANAAIRDERGKLVSLQAVARVAGAGPPIRQLELDLRSNGLPLDALGALLGQDIAGELYGALELRTGPGAPKAEGTLWVNGPVFRGFRQERARWVVAASPAAFSTELELEQRGGRARVSVKGPWEWPGLRLPQIDGRQLQAVLYSERFDLGAIEPLLPDLARGIGGRLDARLVLEPADTLRARGHARLREGNIYVAPLGQEFRDIALDARLDDSGMIAIERLSARAASGRLQASGQIDLDGLGPVAAQLDVNISRGEPVPFMIEGVTVASAWGRAHVTATAEGGGRRSRALDIDVSVPRLQILLPRQTPSDVQELAEDPTIETGTHLSADRFITLPLPPYEDDAIAVPAEDPLVVRIDIELGDEVWVEQEPLLEIKMVGGVHVELERELTVSGQVRLARGDLEVQGRVFQIERGEITFVEEREPGNPTVVATGVYTAPEGTRVYAEFVGPVETGKLTLRSEPPLRDDQILSLLLFGSPDGSIGATSGGADGSFVGGTALVAGGNVLARGLNLELRRLTSLDIQTRIGEREGEPQPEVAVQLTPRLTAELAYRLDAPNPGRAQDRTYLTLDLRLFRNWSLSTTIGDAGSFVLNLLWRYRF